MGIFLCFSSSCYANSQTINELSTNKQNNQINQAQFEMALKWAEEGRLNDANELLLNLYGRTKSPRVLLEGARVLYLAGEYEEAESLFKQVLALNPPMMVRERVIVYLNNIANSRGRIEASFGLIRDTNPKAITNSRTLTILGQTFAYNPQFDTSPQWGMSYLLSGYKNFGPEKRWGAGFNVNGTKFQIKDFDRSGLEEYITYRLFDLPRLDIKASAEQYFFADKILYNMPSVSLKHITDGAAGKYWTNEIKNGWIDYPEYAYLNGIVKSYITTFGMPVAENIILGLEAGVDRTTAVDPAYAFKSRTVGLVANIFIPSEFIKAQVKYSHTSRQYDSPDPFFSEIRQDSKNGVFMNITKINWVFYGLVPSIDLGFENSKSNIELYSYRRVISNITFKKSY